MLYNKDVSLVNVYVFSEASVSIVNQVLQDMVEDMSQTGCPYYTRDTLPPFYVGGIPGRTYSITSCKYPLPYISNISYNII